MPHPQASPEENFFMQLESCVLIFFIYNPVIYRPVTTGLNWVKDFKIGCYRLNYTFRL